MKPLDLSCVPPRSPYATLAGLLMLPRTVDKARALLGGSCAAYYITPGLSAWLLRKLRFTEAEFLELVRTTGTEMALVRVIRDRAGADRIAHLNGYMRGVKVRDLPDEMQSIALTAHSGASRDELLLRVLLEDDVRCFPGGPRVGMRHSSLCALSVLPHGLETFLEEACADCVAPYLSGRLTTRTHLELSDRRNATGEWLQVDVEVQAIDPERISFAVAAHDEVNIVARGVHERAIA